MDNTLYESIFFLVLDILEWEQSNGSGLTAGASARCRLSTKVKMFLLARLSSSRHMLPSAIHA